ncbi:MAG: hypothetical protein KF802_03635 [Bdellovibrionaceae bacterium]|nr:hypothetical protein [Pseudobdellovibrionaceae bacterium]MBX3033286.1 hypothetical protein [Pseudobdellovibrionaceae bacterium]
MKNVLCKLVVLPGSNPDESVRPYYERAYTHWESVWGATFQELDGKSRIFSDNFTRQHEIHALFEDLNCVAMCGLRYYDFRTTTPRKDSYFEAWSEDALDQLVRYGKRVVIASNLSIDPNRRGREATGGQYNLKDLIIATTLRRIGELEIDAMTGTMRVDKNMQGLIYQAGGVPIQREVIYHNVPVDLLAVHPLRKKPLLPSGLDEMTQELWDNARGTGPLDHLLLPKTAARRVA